MSYQHRNFGAGMSERVRKEDFGFKKTSFVVEKNASSKLAMIFAFIFKIPRIYSFYLP